MTSAAVGVVVVEGEHADGATVDHQVFDVDRAGGAPDQVIAALLGTRKSAREAGYRVTSVGIAVSDEAEVAVLRHALAEHQIDNVMLVSPFLAAVALVQATSNVTHYARTGLLFVEPENAALAVVDSADGSITDIQHRRLSRDDDAAVAELTGLVAAAEGLQSGPEGVFAVGAGVDVAMIKPALAEMTSLPFSAPQHQDVALARGAALASADAPLFVSSTSGMAWAQDSGGSNRSPVADSRLLDFNVNEIEQAHKPFMLVGSVLAALFIVGVGSLVIALALSMRSTAADRPSAGGNIIAPAHSAAPPRVQVPGPPSPPSMPPVLRQFALRGLLDGRHGG